MMHRLLNKYGNMVDFEHRIPDCAFMNYYGYTSNIDVGIEADDACTAASFAKHVNSEHLVAVGTDRGYARILDTKKLFLDDDAFGNESFQLSVNLVNSIACFSNSTRFVAGCGAGELFICDFEHKQHTEVSSKSGQMIRHVLANPDDSETFASVNAECVQIWDCRCHNEPKLTIVNVANRKKLNMVCLTYLNGHTVAVAEGLPDGNHDLIPGISLWDLRYQKVSEPYRSLHVPNEVGRITSLGLSRDGDQLFAAGAKKYILEYYLHSGLNPTRAYHYAPQGSYRSQIRMSPFSDHFLVGNRDDGAVLYDFQNVDNYPDCDLPLLGNPLVADNTFPRFEFPGKPVTEEFNSSWGLDWSLKGKYMIMMGLNSVTIWTSDLPEGVEFINQEKTRALLNGKPIDFERPRYSNEYSSQVSDPRQNRLFGLDEEEMNPVTYLARQLKQNISRKRTIQTRLNDENTLDSTLEQSCNDHRFQKEVTVGGLSTVIKRLTPLDVSLCNLALTPAKRRARSLTSPNPLRDLKFYFKSDSPVLKMTEDC